MNSGALFIDELCIVMIIRRRRFLVLLKAFFTPLWLVLVLLFGPLTALASMCRER